MDSPSLYGEDGAGACAIHPRAAKHHSSWVLVRLKEGEVRDFDRLLSIGNPNSRRCPVRLNGDLAASEHPPLKAMLRLAAAREWPRGCHFPAARRFKSLSLD